MASTTSQLHINGSRRAVSAVLTSVDTDSSSNGGLLPCAGTATLSRFAMSSIEAVSVSVVSVGMMPRVGSSDVASGRSSSTKDRTYNVTSVLAVCHMASACRVDKQLSSVYQQRVLRQCYGTTLW